MFSIRLVDNYRPIAKQTLSETAGDADALQDDIVSLTHEICEALAELNAVTFSAEGFGNAWPVDVRTDLAVLIPQLPAALNSLDSEELSAFELDFYEQGVERSVTFEIIESRVSMHCQSLGDWIPSFASDESRVRDIYSMLCAVLCTFVNAARKYCPHIAAHPSFVAWCKQVSVSRCLLRRDGGNA